MIDPIALRIGPLSIHWYGIVIAVAAGAGVWLGRREARFRGQDPELMWTVLTVTFVSGLIGARAYHVIHEWDALYRNHLELILQVWNGGIGIPGGIIGGLAGLVIYSRLSGLPLARWMDILAAPVLLAQVIGRVGNFVNQELYGPPTTLPWGIPIEAGHRIPPYTDLDAYPLTTRFQPLFAYESVLNLVGLAVVLFVGHRFKARLYEGDLALIYFVWYGTVRSVLEGLRTGNWLVGGIPTAVILGVGAAVGCAALLVLRHLRGWGRPGSWAVPPGSEAGQPG